MPILPSRRDPRLITIRRGGLLTDPHHHALMRWSLLCAKRVLPLFERESDDPRVLAAFEAARAWLEGTAPMKSCHQAAFAANAAGRSLSAPAKLAALAAGQAVAVAHVPAHNLGAAAYAIRAAMATALPSEAEVIRWRELRWQRARIPRPLRPLVLDDQRARSGICWHVFD